MKISADTRQWARLEWMDCFRLERWWSWLVEILVGAFLGTRRNGRMELATDEGRDDEGLHR